MKKTIIPKFRFTLIYWVVLLFGIGLYAVLNFKYFTRPFDPVYFGNLYSQSQYVIGEQSIGGIGDDGLYAFAGYYYLFQKGDVSQVNFEHPPLGKYLIGASIYLFNNQNVINIIYYLLILLLTYRLSEIMFRNKIHSVLSVYLVAGNTFFLDHLIRSMLDLPFTLAFVAALYFFILGIKKARYILLSFFMWSLALSVKFFPGFIFIFPLLLFIRLKTGKKHWVFFILGSLLMPLIYLLVHFSYFFYHPSVLEFLRHKKWMVDWWMGSPILPGNFLRSLFTGYYVDSLGNVVYERHWNLLMPAIAVLAVSSFRKSYLSSGNLKYLLVFAVTVIYLFYLIFFGGGILKFIMPVYPIMAVLAVNNIGSLYSIISKWMRPKSPLSKAR